MSTRGAPRPPGPRALRTAFRAAFARRFRRLGSAGDPKEPLSSLEPEQAVAKFQKLFEDFQSNQRTAKEIPDLQGISARQVPRRARWRRRSHDLMDAYARAHSNSRTARAFRTR